MISDAAMIDAIVREVLERLTADRAAPSRKPTSSTPPITTAAAAGTLVIDTKVVSWATLAKQLDGIQTVRVRPGAIVTPSARDELTARRIVIEQTNRTTPSAPAAIASSPTSKITPEMADSAAPRGKTRSWVFAVDGATSQSRAGLVAAVQRAVMSRHKDGQVVAGHDHVMTAARLFESQRNPTAPTGTDQAVWLTQSPASAVIEANRHPALRAIWAGEDRELDDQIDETNANVLVLSVDRAGTFVLARLIGRFLERPKVGRS